MLTIDIHEPSEALSYISQSIPAQVKSLNTDGWADYHWQTWDGADVHAERKQWSEVLSGIDSVEDQLRRQMAAKPKARLIFILEGMAIGSMLGTTVLKGTNKNSVFIPGLQSSIRLSQVYSWLYQISTFLEVYQVGNYEGVCTLLVSMFKSDQKQEHRTFSRYFKPITFNPNPRVVELMGLCPGIGEVRASALIEQFVTVYRVVTASPAELATVPGIGPKLSLDILRRVGRTDV